MSSFVLVYLKYCQYFGVCGCDSAKWGKLKTYEYFCKVLYCVPYKMVLYVLKLYVPVFYCFLLLCFSCCLSNNVLFKLQPSLVFFSLTFLACLSRIVSAYLSLDECVFVCLLFTTLVLFFCFFERVR